MSTNALGFIEVVGMTSAVEAADSAVKSANVSLIGYELTKGDGLIVVKIEGDVGAVKAGLDSAKASVLKMGGEVYSVLVIARPADGLDKIVNTRETVGHKVEAKKEDKAEHKEEIKEVQKEVQKEAPQKAELEAPPAKEEAKHTEGEHKHAEENSDEAEKKKKKAGK